MHPLEKKTLKIIQQEKLLQAGEKLIIGVSAGPDSMALLHVLTRLAPVLDITLAAVYVNHGLRPQASVKEESLVKEEAERIGADFFSGTVDVKGLAARQKISTEHAARLLRYEFLEKTAREYGAPKIAVAHTADDQAEEILLRLIRGTARKGLSGMKTIRAGRIIRPFLCLPKSHLLAYLEKYSIPFLLDNSNTQNLYLRNRIRNELLPYLAKSYNPEIRQTLLRTATILQDEEELLAKMTESAFTAMVSTIPETFWHVRAARPQDDESQPQGLQLNLDLFSLQPRAIQRRLLEKCCWLMECEPSSRQIGNLLQLAMTGAAGRNIHLANGLRVAKEEEHLNFSYPQGMGPFRGDLSSTAEIAFPEISIPGPGTYKFPGLGKKLLVEQLNKPAEMVDEVFPTGEYLDASLFSFPLTIRGPEPGDRFHPLGAPGSKKVSDFLTDQKVERATRRQQPVLCSNDAILALPGLRIDHRYRITDKTTHVLRVCWQDME